jgi:hypothetical protein
MRTDFVRIYVVHRLRLRVDLSNSKTISAACGNATGIGSDCLLGCLRIDIRASQRLARNDLDSFSWPRGSPQHFSFMDADCVRRQLSIQRLYSHVPNNVLFNCIPDDRQQEGDPLDQRWFLKVRQLER